MDIFIKSQQKQNEIYNKYTSLYQPSNDLAFKTPSINYEKLKQNKLIKEVEEKIKDDERNKRIQSYLQMTPQNLTNYPILPKPNYKSGKLSSRI